MVWFHVSNSTNHQTINERYILLEMHRGWLSLLILSSLLSDKINSRLNRHLCVCVFVWVCGVCNGCRVDWSLTTADPLDSSLKWWSFQGDSIYFTAHKERNHYIHVIITSLYSCNHYIHIMIPSMHFCLVCFHGEGISWRRMKGFRLSGLDLNIFNSQCLMFVLGAL